VTATAPPPTTARLTRRGGRRAAAGALRREAAIFTLGMVVIAVHVLDDNFVQPQPGRRPAITWSAAWFRSPCSALRCGRIRLCAAVVGARSR
jgi:hypothetical protein